jgi:hypothetical protein
MDDANQIEVPPSFMAVYTTSAGRLAEPAAVVRDRYEHCEDLAQMLTEHAASLQFKTGAPETELLGTVRQGLSGEDAGLRAFEADWIVRRLAELLGWDAPG